MQKCSRERLPGNRRILTEMEAGIAEVKRGCCGRAGGTFSPSGRMQAKVDGGRHFCVSIDSRLIS